MMEDDGTEAQPERLNPYAAEKLSPSHLELLFPAIFYKSDEDLSLHLSQSCLIEALAWEGDKAIGETAFWLKVLSTPQTEYLKQQKKLFKFAIAERCKDISGNYNSPGLGIAPEVITLDLKTSKPTQPKPVPPPRPPPVLEKRHTLKPVIRVTTAENGTQVGILTTVQETVETSVTDHMITDNEWDLIEKHLNTGVVTENSTAASAAQPAAVTQLQNESSVDITSPTPGFGIKTYKCRHCEFASDNRAGLNRHQKINHSEELPFSCDRCDYTSKYAWSVKTHIDSVHLKSRRFQCPDCEYATSQACFLKRHTLRRHNLEKGAFRCTYCDYAAHHPNSLMRHVNRQHTQNFTHRCPYCDFGRDCKYLVEDHINDVHLKKVIYQCAECSFQTYKQRALKSHHKTHLNRSVMQCSECEFKSVSVGGLTKHMKQEHPNVDAKATVAGSRGRKDLSAVVEHDGDEYTAVVMGKCKHCEYANENLIKLKAHVRRYHKRGNAKCPYCNFAAVTKVTLKKHIANKHPNMNTTTNQPSAHVIELSGREMIIPETVLGEEVETLEENTIPSSTEQDIHTIQDVDPQTATMDSLPTVSIMEVEDGGIIVLQNPAE